MTMKGKAAHLKRLRGLSTDAVKVAGRVVFVGSDMIRAEAQNSITTGSVSGKNHVPSAPGQPPNNDTSVLKGNIVNLQTGPLSAEVRSEAPYASSLELGTSKMEARPYMRPARDKLKPKIETLFATEIGKLVRNSGR